MMHGMRILVRFYLSRHWGYFGFLAVVRNAPGILLYEFMGGPKFPAASILYPGLECWVPGRLHVYGVQSLPTGFPK